MNKKSYSKPEIEVNAFAQFENVFSMCSYASAEHYCTSQHEDWKGDNGQGSWGFNHAYAGNNGPTS